MSRIICAWCKKFLGWKLGGSGTTHGICKNCKKQMEAEI